MTIRDNLLPWLQQLESNKIAALAAKMQKIEDASRKKDEQTSQFISATRDALEQKMENHTEKREAYITDLKTKLKVIVARESSADGCYKARL